MPTQVRLHQLAELSHPTTTNEVFIETETNTELHIRVDNSGDTTIRLPFGKKFDVIDGQIIIRKKLTTGK